MPTPILYALGKQAPYTSLAPELESNTLEVLYVTDRQPGDTTDGRFTYTSERSPSLAFGHGVVVIGDDTTWQQLAADANSAKRKKDLGLSLRSVVEVARAPPVPHPFEMVNGQPVTLPEVQAELEATIEVFREEIKRRLAHTARKEVLIYVHGVANTFEDALYTTGEIWHFLGREGVPIAYTWPAGGGGLLTGYTYDRESSEFTIYHMKNFLKLLTLMPEVEHVQLISHSRGTDVVGTALRELVIESRAKGEDPLSRFKIANVVLAAPDLDLGVTLQRSASERLSTAVKRLTIYSSKNDKALGLADFLFGSVIRLGQVDETVVPEEARGVIASVTNVAVIEYVGTKTGGFGHNYFRTNPAVASDLVLTVRYDRNPGAENGRPLVHKGTIFWELDDDYLQGEN